MKKKRLSERAKRAKAEHDEWVKKKLSNVPRPDIIAEPFVGFDRPIKTLPPLSNVAGNGFKRSVDDYKWKKGREELPSTIREIEKKKTRLAPVANKTGYQYITDGADVETLGKKV